MNRFMIAIATIGFAAGVTIADQIPDRATLETILGGGGTLENFETADIGFGGQLFDGSGFLDSTSIFAGQGPGLVQPGARYVGQPNLWWNGDGYFALNTQSLGDSSGWRGLTITIEYSPSVTAAGFDMQGYSGFPMDGDVSVYDASGGLISTTLVDGGFFGWEDAGGIGSMVVNAFSGYIMIDDHLYGDGDPLTLEVTSTSCPAAGPATLTATGGSGGTIGFAYSLNGAGNFVIPTGFTCAGTQLGLAAPVALGGSAAGNPAVLNVGNVPGAACGNVTIQAIDATTCATSNTATFN